MSWRRKVLTNEANVLLEIHLGELGIEFGKEHKFHPYRDWRFDYILLPPIAPDLAEVPKVAIEIEGGIHTQGRHVRGTGYARDLVKYREAAAMGWRVYRFSTEEVLTGVAREFIDLHCGACRALTARMEYASV